MAKGIPLTYSTLMAAGQDAGNRSTRKAGRTKWSRDDWNAAAAECARLMPYLLAEQFNRPLDECRAVVARDFAQPSDFDIRR